MNAYMNYRLLEIGALIAFSLHDVSAIDCAWHTQPLAVKMDNLQWVDVTYRLEPKRIYQLETTVDVDNGWAPVGDPLQSQNGELHTMRFRVTAEEHRFYRLRAIEKGGK